jgi:IS6 family transposase
MIARAAMSILANDPKYRPISEVPSARVWLREAARSWKRGSSVRAVDQHGQVIDVYVSPRRDSAAVRRFFEAALRAHSRPAEVVTDKAATLIAVVEVLLPDACHNTEQYANNRVECDHGRLKARLRPMRGLKRDRAASIVIRGHAFIRNVRRGHYELGADPRDHHLRVAAAFDELAQAL